MVKQFQIGVSENRYYITNSTLGIPEEDFEHLINDVIGMLVAPERLECEYEISINADALERMTAKEKAILELFVKKHNEYAKTLKRIME